MKNDYEIRGNVTVIFLDRKDGARLECLIDTADLPRAMEFPNTWFAHQQPITGYFYVVGHVTLENGEKRFIKLHRWILGVTKSSDFVDHINHDTLNNRRSNLRVVDCSFNTLNRKGADSKNHSSGYLGVTYEKNRAKWKAYLNIQGRHYNLGRYLTKEEAYQVAIKARVDRGIHLMEANI
jgi:hypothetical protein